MSKRLLGEGPMINNSWFEDLESPSLQELMNHLPKIRTTSIYETQAEMYMEGLKAQVTEIERRLKADEQLMMICWQGHEKMQVQSVTMPSHNVVALTCIDEEGTVIQVTGHMNAITFSFRIIKTSVPAKRNQIGFEMSSKA